MPKPKRPHEHDDLPEADRGGKDREVILDIVNRRLEGGAAPTPRAYARALEQWHKLPGAVVHVPATVTGAQEAQNQETESPDESKGALRPGQDAPEDERR